ncbi:MAG: hypothetical protein H0T46_15195 [Deltaproteobacteria bacterium]|nr:hypothetical protein [Deltaproteobacteria bacterium]
MTPRHIVLVVASVALLAAGVYLFREVNATPATTDVAKRPVKASEPAQEEPDTAQPDKAPDRSASRRPPPPVRSAPAETMGKGPAIEPNLDNPTPVIENVADELNKPNPRMDAVMAEANKAYDKGDFDEAKGIALKVIAKEPTNVRMLRIVVSSACIDGNSAEAEKHYQVLPPGDREQMKVRCERYGVTFNDK